MSTTREPHPFVKYLLELAEDRAALAALRRGLGRPPGTVPEMFPYVIPFLPRELGLQEEATYYTLAALFALHPSHTYRGNMGDHMAQAAYKGNREAVERRFVALLAARSEDLPERLRQTIGFLKAQEVRVNWDALFSALRYWNHSNYGARIRREWARAFWAVTSEDIVPISES
ncbi:MAG: type I-E CRISPR-associated protein Cse2/CasB [Clostridiales bacterium]|nr:type I-E CRISPR-associated protein Cse2/CasB [Clostridiales bacterium]